MHAFYAVHMGANQIKTELKISCFCTREVIVIFGVTCTEQENDHYNGPVGFGHVAKTKWPIYLFISTMLLCNCIPHNIFNINLVVIHSCTRLPGAVPQPIGLFLFCIGFGWG